MSVSYLKYQFPIDDEDMASVYFYLILQKLDREVFDLKVNYLQRMSVIKNFG